MADTHKDLDYLRFYFASEESLKDKDRLKNQAFNQYRNNTSILCAAPVMLQLAHLRFLNQTGYAHYLLHLRRVKVFSFIGAFAAVWNEKAILE